MYHLSVGGLYIVVIAPYLYQSGSGQLAVHIVIQAAVFSNYSVLHLYLFGEHYSALRIKAVDAFGQQAICLGYPVTLSAYKRTGRGFGIIVIIADLHQAVCNDNTVHTIIVVSTALVYPVRITFKVFYYTVIAELIVVSGGQTQAIVINDFTLRFII